MMKKFIVTCIILFSCLLFACSIQTQNPSRRTVKMDVPLSQPIYGGASVAPFNQENMFKKLNDEFIFKGKIEKIQEIDVNYNVGTTEDIFMVDRWLTVCDVKIENILYGGIPGIKDTLKVVSGQSTRCLDSSEFRLLEGQEYYFITYVFSQKEPVNIENDSLRIYEFGDVMAGTFYDLFPINNGVVSFQGWTFEGADPPTVTNDNYAKINGIASTINEKSFLKQFVEMIQDAKNKQDLGSAQIDDTSIP